MTEVWRVLGILVLVLAWAGMVGYWLTRPPRRPRRRHWAFYDRRQTTGVEARTRAWGPKR